ncbi:hypothetical protein [Croceicoccus hydrothermalis]|uniref:hypothetical protein n=1 Tax=Croceicoccus hydrothermalis TaxID=2867964 RepID=UPI001EFA53D1|nr:hypothetical protein [Croceicoccus hydrothermalis]
MADLRFANIQTQKVPGKISTKASNAKLRPKRERATDVVANQTSMLRPFRTDCAGNETAHCIAKEGLVNDAQRNAGNETIGPDNASKSSFPPTADDDEADGNMSDLAKPSVRLAA